MKKTISVTVEYAGNVYVGTPDIYDEAEEKALKELMKKVMSDKINYFELACSDKILYFSESILKKSVLGLIYL